MFNELVGEHLEGLSPNDVMDAYDDDLLSLDECKQILEAMGHPELVNWIEAQEEDTPSIRH
jgi:CO dehydrogenase/acetyl-CoA synthase beta subunit